MYSCILSTVLVGRTSPWEIDAVFPLKMYNAFSRFI